MNTYLGTVAGLSFYECGKHGDEAPLLIKFGGEMFYSEMYEMPSQQEAEDYKFYLANQEQING